MEITAQFIGKNGSCGYKNGQWYDLVISSTSTKGEIRIMPLVRKDASPVLYESYVGLFANWRNISQL